MPHSGSRTGRERARDRNRYLTVNSVDSADCFIVNTLIVLMLLDCGCFSFLNRFGDFLVPVFFENSQSIVIFLEVLVELITDSRH